MTHITLDAFPGAPPGSWISEDGWLVVGDEAWSAQEWALRPPPRRWRDRRDWRREYMRRYRAANPDYVDQLRRESKARCKKRTAA